MTEGPAVRQEIERMAREVEAAFKRGDMASIADGFAEDAIVMPPGSGAVRGRQAIRGLWQALKDELGVREVAIEVQEVEASGDLAYEIGRTTLRSQPPGGQATTDTIKYLAAWRRQPSGRWQVAADIWNSSS